MMRNLFFFIVLVISTSAQSQIIYNDIKKIVPDDEGKDFSNRLKKIDKKGKFGCYASDQTFTFGINKKGYTGDPVVSATEEGYFEMVSMENDVDVSYLAPYNNFVKLDKVGVEVFYNKKFKSQYANAQRVSLGGDDIFFDDNDASIFGIYTPEAGTRVKMLCRYKYDDAKYLTRVFFHDNYSTLKSRLTFKVPSWLKIDFAEINFQGYKITKEVKEEKDITVYSFEVEDLEPVINEPFSLGRPSYLPHLIVTVRSFTYNKLEYSGFKGLDDLYKWYNFLYKKSGNKTDDLKAQVSTLITGKSDEDKVKAIYYWIQDNIRYIAFEEGYAGFIPTSCQDVYKNKYGDCKGMANLMTEMLKLAGFDAHFAWIGTRDLPYDRKVIQSLCIDNHAICVLYFNGNKYFLDGTEKFVSIYKNAYRIQGKSVLVESGDTYKVEQVPVTAVNDNKYVTIAKLKYDETKISGSVEIKIDGEAKTTFLNIYYGIPADKRKEFLADLLEFNRNTEVSNVKTSDFKNRDIAIKLSGDVEISNSNTKADDLVYTSIDFFPPFLAKYLPAEERRNPIDIRSVWQSTQEVTLELPTNKKPKTLPESLIVKHQSNEVNASYSFVGNTITLKKQMTISDPVIMAKEFKEWKSLIDKTKQFNRNNIVIQSK
jgi:transglutaminase-like putative cysteine protease